MPKTVTVTDDVGSAVLQETRHSLNALLDLIKSSADFAALQLAIEADGSGVNKVQVVPESHVYVQGPAQ